MKLAIATLRQKHNLTQQQLADCLGVGESFVSKLESGMHGDRIVRSIQLAQALNCSLADLHNLEAARKQAGLSKAEVAQLAGVSDRTVRSWESGEKQMEGLELAIALCNVFGVQPGDLLA